MVFPNLDYTSSTLSLEIPGENRTSYLSGALIFELSHGSPNQTSLKGGALACRAMPFHRSTPGWRSTQFSSDPMYSSLRWAGHDPAGYPFTSARATTTVSDTLVPDVAIQVVRSGSNPFWLTQVRHIAVGTRLG